MRTINRIGQSNGLFLLLLLPVILLLTPAHRAFAQAAGTASVQGTVIDATGAAIPNATVTLTQTATGVARTTTTDGRGLYALPNVAVGAYSLNVTASGFTTYTQTGTLEVGNSISIDPQLKVGNASEHIEVQASGVALETETSTFKQVIDQARITELPLNGRQATQLVLVSGGAVTAPGNDMVGSKNYPSSTVIAVAGSQGNYNNYVLDGGYHTDNFTNVNLPYPFPDALHEFSVESNSLPARNGIHPGSMVNVITNSGSNQWHGTAFDFVRNNVINATNFFSTSKDTVKRNQFGGTLGGKIITDKLFFFGGYQGTREHKTSSSTAYCLPTDAMLAGDFSQMPASGNCARSSTAFKDPFASASGTVSPIPTRKLDPSKFSPAALALVKYLPLSQRDSAGRVNIGLPGNNTEDQYIGRMDYTWSQRHSLFGRYYLTSYNLPSYFSPSNILLTTLAGNDMRVQSFTLGDTFIFSPHLVNTFHGTYSRRRNNRGPTAGGINATTLGVKLFVYVPVDLRIQMSGTGFNTGCGTCSPGYFNVNTEHFADDIDWSMGKHQIAFGGEIIRTGDNTRAGYLNNGSYTFNGLASGEPLADFLTGQMTGSPTAFAQSRTQDTTYRQTTFSIYGQDTWHITSRLTVNYGARWEPNLYQVDKFGRGATFDRAAFNANQHSTTFPLAPAGSFFYGDAGVPKSFTSNRLANISPRVGLTLDPFGTGKTVFRVGGAMMYDTPPLYMSQRVASNPPFVNEIDLAGQIPFDDPWQTGKGGTDPFPGVFPPNATSTFPTNTLWVLMQRTMKTPVIYQWNASVQQDLGHGWMFSLNYLGNQQAHQWLGSGINAAVYIPGNWSGPGSCQGMPQILVGSSLYPAKNGDACSSTSNPNARTPLTLANNTQGQGYSPTMTLITDGGTSSYNGLIAAIQHRMSNNFSFLANYTWSKCLDINDTTGDIAAPLYQHTTNARLDRGPCGFDVRHIFNTTLVASSHFHSLQGWKGAVANNWQVAPLIRILSGQPLNVTSGQDLSRTGVGLDRPNLIQGADPYTHNKIQSTGANLAYLNKAAFAPNAVGTYGNVGRYAFRTPGNYFVDLSVSRTFAIHERLNFQLRMESFNVLNHPNFGPVNAANAGAFTLTQNNGTFGNVTGAMDPRIFQLAGKFNF
jgi:hypothetical protein